QATPATWRLLVESGWAGSAGLKILCGGEALARSLAAELAGRGAAVWNLYGPTETTIWSAVGRVEAGAGEGLVSVGGPIANTQMYVLDAELEPAPVGVVGELYIGGEGLARGYLNRPELTAERFVPHPHGEEAGARLYRTGDVARYRSDGGMEVVGRVDQQVKLRGHRIELGEVESVLNGCEGVSQAVVLLREDAPGDRRLVAYLSSGAEAESITTTELREYLRERLPEYMMPSAFVMLREWPLTPNGKVDRKALPAPDRSTRPDGAEHAAPRSRAEKVLADIWAEVLGMESVGINDNFFELGGDSILGIQAVARANRAGFELIPRQLFQHQTIAALASAAGPAPVLRTEQGAVTGSVPLTPVQHWFFEKDLPDPHHSNQSVLLEVRGGLNISALEESVRLLLAHHDALRLRFARTETGWQQWHAAADEPVPVSLVVLPSATDEEYREAVSAAAAEAQATLNLFHGPLMRVTAFRSERGLPDRLHVAIHQLAVDGVSWRVLFEDLQLCYEELAEGRTPRLPPKTTSYQYWAQRLSDYAQTEAVRQEAAYWLWETGTLSEPLPIDFEGRGESGHADSARTVSVSLGAEATAGLLYDAPRSYRVQVNDVLLTALARSFARWTANNSLMVCVESHGRQDIFGDVDFTRTVGWFTALFPVRLTLPGEAHPGEQLKAIKEQLRRVPNHGLGYGLLRYLCRDAQTARSVGELASPEVLFNYFGNVDQALDEAAPFTLCEDEARRERSPSESRGFMFEVNTYVTDGSLVSNWTYDSNLHRRETVEALAEGFMESVRLLADYCRGAETTAGYTPSDFPKSKLNQTELDHLLSKISASRGELA
ncbi:MAG TPA: condensation domain-containing protein, partial [Pyrinomonadaceae bacterium]